MKLLSFYPADWLDITQVIKAANHYECCACGRQCRRPGEFYLGWQYELTVAHYDNEYDAPAVFLVALCARCHLLHDAPFVWVARRRHCRQRQRQAGQLELQLAASVSIHV